MATKTLDDFATIPNLPDANTRILRIPAPLLCYWMGEAEAGAMDIREPMRQGVPE